MRKFASHVHISMKFQRMTRTGIVMIATLLCPSALLVVAAATKAFAAMTAIVRELKFGIE